MKSSAELDAIREKLRVAIGYSCAIDEKVDTKILVRMSDDGVKAAGEVVRAFMEEIERLALAHVKVTKLGSVTKVDGEPVVEVIVPGKNKVVYTDVDANTAREIIAKLNK